MVEGNGSSLFLACHSHDSAGRCVGYKHVLAADAFEGEAKRKCLCPCRTPSKRANASLRQCRANSRGVHERRRCDRERGSSITKKIKIIPYPVTTQSCCEEAERTPWAQRERKVLFVGKVHPEKGVHVLISAFASIAKELRANWCLEIVGPKHVSSGGGGAKYLKELQRLSAPIQESVRWVGGVFDSAHLTRIFSSARIFVYLSLADKGETFWLAPLEAMACGCVPVVSQLSCFEDYVDDGGCGLMFDHTEARPELALTTVLERLMRDVGRAKALANAASVRAGTFSLERIVRLRVRDFSAIVGREEPIEGALELG